MTKLFKTLGLALAVGFFFGTILVVHADDPSAKDDNGSAPKGSDHGWNKKDWGGMWKDKFGLTDSQIQKLKDLMKKHKDETQALTDQIKIDMDTLKLKVDSKASDDEIKTLLDNLLAEKKSMQAKQQSFIDEARTILTPAQQAKFLLKGMVPGMGGWGGHGMWGHRGKMDSGSCPMGKGGDVGDKGGQWKHKGHMKKDGDSSNHSTPADAAAPAGSGNAN